MAPEAVVEAVAPGAALEAATGATREPGFDKIPTSTSPYVGPFDFWNVIVSDFYVGSEQFCLAERVRQTDPGTLLVSCARASLQETHARGWIGTPLATVEVSVDARHDIAAIVPSVRERDLSDIDTLLLLKVTGYDDNPRAELTAMDRLARVGDEDPTQRPSRCCRREKRTPAPRAEFFVDRLHHQQHCVVKHLNVPRRSSSRHGVVTASGGCENGSSTAHVQFYFSEQTAGLVTQRRLEFPGRMYDEHTFIVQR